MGSLVRGWGESVLFGERCLVIDSIEAWTASPSAALSSYKGTLLIFLSYCIERTDPIVLTEEQQPRQRSETDRK